MVETEDLEEYRLMFKQRLLSGIVLVVIAAAGLYIGGFVTLAMIAIVALIGYNELLKIFDIDKSSLAVLGYTGTILYYGSLFFGLETWSTAIIILFMIFILGCYVIRFPKYHMNQVFGCFFGFVYVSIMLSYVYQLRVAQNGGEFILLIFLAAWGNDTLAYCVGKLTGKTIGNHKMTPSLSPKKSIEGLIGGIVGAAILGAIYGGYLKTIVRFSFNPIIVFAMICGIGAAISVIGDLAASAIKRDSNIKDYGTLIPGHGGILDRFDSIILIAPVIYYLTLMLSGGAV